MGQSAASAGAWKGDEVLRAFADKLRAQYGAVVYAFGSRARGNAELESDYDIIAVSSRFEGVSFFKRVPDRYSLWIEAGGWGKGLDLLCFTPEEFRSQLRFPTFVQSARRRRELIRVA